MADPKDGSTPPPDIGPSPDATPMGRDLPSSHANNEHRRGECTMKRFVYAVAVLIVPGVAFAAEAGSRTHHPPTTASLMPAYVEAAKYWRAPAQHRRPGR